MKLKTEYIPLFGFTLAIIIQIPGSRKTKNSDNHILYFLDLKDSCRNLSPTSWIWRISTTKKCEYCDKTLQQNGAKRYEFFLKYHWIFSQIYNSLSELFQWNRFKYHTEISTAVIKVIQSCFRRLWHSWKRVQPYYKQTWFSMFKVFFMLYSITISKIISYVVHHVSFTLFFRKIFNRDVSTNYHVGREFNKLAAYRLKKMISHAKNKGETYEKHV